MRISSQNLLYLVIALAEDEELTTIEDLTEHLEKLSSVFEIAEI